MDISFHFAFISFPFAFRSFHVCIHLSMFLHVARLSVEFPSKGAWYAQTGHAGTRPGGGLSAFPVILQNPDAQTYTNTLTLVFC